MYSNIVVSRTDRMGDLILSTPVFKALKLAFPQAHVHVLASEYAADLIDGLDSVDTVFRVNPKKMSIGEVRNIFRKTQCDLFLSLENHLAVQTAAFLEKVPVRVGPKNHWYSYLFLNRGVRQRRSQVEMHEAEYGLDLLKCLGDENLNRICADVKTEVASADDGAIETWLKAMGSAKRILVHPGMGGSALNLSPKQYAEIVRALVRRTDAKVVMSFGPTEGDLRDHYQRVLGTEGKEVSFWSGTVRELVALIAHVDLVIVPSTGPLHIAVALKKPVVTFFPPVRVQSSKRWGPFRANPADVLLFDPEVAKGAPICHQVFECVGEKCAHYRCMDGLDLNWVVGWAKQKLGMNLKTGGVRENHPAS